MDYVLGSVAALVTGNVTPNRPKLLKRALTPTKHQPSPNVTPKSEFVEDRSIFLSPSMQKKKAIVKKSPKRIFQNPDLETTENSEGNLSLTSPKADKVKKHLQEELDAGSVVNLSSSSLKSPKKKGKNKRESTSIQESKESLTDQADNETTPKKKKKKQNSESDTTENVSILSTENVNTENTVTAAKSPKKKKQRRKSVVDTDSAKENVDSEVSNIYNKSPKKQENKLNSPETAQENNKVAETSNNNTPTKKKNKKRKKKANVPATEAATENKDKESDGTDKENVQKENQVTTKKKNKKRKKSKAPQNKPEIMETNEPDPVESENEEMDEEDTNTSGPVNPNAITDKESDSEHESDDEIESENEEINKKVLETEKPEESSDEEEEKPQKSKMVEKKEVEKKEGDEERMTEEEIKRTLFVGNVPFSAKVKKELKKIFSKHGQIQTIRIRTVPIKDGRYTPKLALIKNELHPERTTVNVYIKYADEESVEKALVENNTVLNENHLRVSRSSSTGAEHDPKCSVFIGNMPFAMEDEALRAKFEKCGQIHSVRIIRDKKTNAGKGFGYVNFESKDAVELALALTEEDLTVKNRILRVKRCTQTTTKKKPVKENTGQKQSGYKGGNHQPNQQNRNFNNQTSQQRGGFRGGNNQGGGFRGNNQQGGFRSGENENSQQRGGFRPGSNQGFQQRSGPPSRNNQGNRQRAFGDRNNQQRGGFNNKFDGQRNLPQKDEHGREGAHRRVMNKRKSQDAAGGDAPPNKKQKDMNEPVREKKSRKEFVGMTAEKKKKRKFDKGQKKKKALSEILTK
ncbi:hypothetical protein PYW08_009894 [Mythimna loreyi]|uniref:Uncharacterized protein n=1 Tax=Mythimna loreyi TaxID=667449 RepID=A0ACC2QC50_9NEOP|nr:hypothetical protein PYW08_009894 [Mythimna loreyi]